MTPELIAQSEAYLDEVFWPGAGQRHSRFLEHIEHDGLRDAVHRCHLTQSDRTALSLRDNYLIGMCVLYAGRCFGPAGMFARTLLHLGVDRRTVLEATARLRMWIGTVPAAEIAGHVQRAIRDYEQNGVRALAAWVPEAGDD